MFKKDDLEIDIVVFEPEHQVIVAGAQTGNIKAGWKNCTIEMLSDGVLIKVPGYAPTYVHRAKTRQIFFK